MVRRRQQVVANRIMSNTSEKRKKRDSRFKDRLRMRRLAEGRKRSAARKGERNCWTAWRWRCRQDGKSSRGLFLVGLRVRMRVRVRGSFTG